MGQGNLELVLLVDQLFFGLLEIWLLDSDNHCQKLILKTRLSDDEVNDCALSSGFWLVVRVDKLGLKIQFEGVAQFNIFGTKFDGEALTLLDELSGEEWIENGIDFLTDGLDHEDLTTGYGHLDLLEPGFLTKLDDLHLGSLFTLDPLLTLKLWIDDEWVSVAGGDDCGVLKGDSIGWETLSLPDGLIGSVGKDLKWVNTWGDWDGLLSDIWNPLVLPELGSEEVGEWSDV